MSTGRVDNIDGDLMDTLQTFDPLSSNNFDGSEDEEMLLHIFTLW